jgi:hypothetical protein
MSGVEHIADHDARFLAITPLIHKVRPVRKALIRVIAKMIQSAEDNLWAAYTSAPLRLSSGRGLDLWGWLAGVGPRAGLSDKLYKQLITLGFRSKYSGGTIDDVILLWAAATGGKAEFLAYPFNTIVVVAYVDAWLPTAYMRRAAEVTRRGCPVGSTVLLESLNIFLGDELREGSPQPAVPPSSGTGAKSW